MQNKLLSNLTVPYKNIQLHFVSHPIVCTQKQIPAIANGPSSLTLFVRTLQHAIWEIAEAYAGVVLFLPVPALITEMAPTSRFNMHAKPSQAKRRTARSKGLEFGQCVVCWIPFRKWNKSAQIFVHVLTLPAHTHTHRVQMYAYVCTIHFWMFRPGTSRTCTNTYT